MKTITRIEELITQLENEHFDCGADEWIPALAEQLARDYEREKSRLQNQRMTTYPLIPGLSMKSAFRKAGFGGAR